MPKEYCPNKVQLLPKNGVFVFGSNLQGFHGAGAAGVAMRGTPKNDWRSDEKFIRAIRSPEGHPARIGRWAVFGVGKGHQVGKYGESYAIATVVRPGRKKSIPLSNILKQLEMLGDFARSQPEKKFFVVISGGGYNGWTVEEIKEVYRRWCKNNPPPENVLLKREYEFRK